MERSRVRGGTARLAQRVRYTKTHAKGRFLDMSVPADCSDEDPTSTAANSIQLYVVDRPQAWLDFDELEWALRFMYMQHALRGVPVVSPECKRPDAQR